MALAVYVPFPEDDSNSTNHDLVSRMFTSFQALCQIWNHGRKKKSKLSFSAILVELPFEICSAHDAWSMRFFLAATVLHSAARRPVLCCFALSCRFEVSAVPTQKHKTLPLVLYHAIVSLHRGFYAAFLFLEFPIIAVLRRTSCIYAQVRWIAGDAVSSASSRGCGRLRSVAARPTCRMCSVHRRNYPLC